MKITKIVKTSLAGLAIVGAVLSAGCGGPKEPKDMTFDELMKDMSKNIEVVATERDKMIEDYIKKDSETYKVFTIEDKFMSGFSRRKILDLNLTAEQINKTEEAINEITKKTEPQVNRMLEEQKRAEELLNKRALDKDQASFNNDKRRYETATNLLQNKITHTTAIFWNPSASLETKFVKVRDNFKLIKEVYEKNKQK